MTEDATPGPFVARQIKQLVGDHPDAMRPWARGMLAQLRTAASAEPGTAPAVWAVTAEGVPEGLAEANRERFDVAVHLALSQFATHQQARNAPMHKHGQSFGRAVRMLAERSKVGDADIHEGPVYQRFTALSMTTSRAGIVAHSRGLISQLRAAEIPFDYAAYADDLYWLQTPRGAARVHRTWGRDFHTSPRSTADQNDTTETTIEGDES